MKRSQVKALATRSDAIAWEADPEKTMFCQDIIDLNLSDETVDTLLCIEWLEVEYERLLAN